MLRVALFSYARKNNILRHFAVLFSLFVLVAVTPLVLLIVLEKSSYTKPTSTLTNAAQMTGAHCYYKKINCLDSTTCDSSILTCPSSLVQPLTQISGTLSPPTGLFENADCQKLTGWAYNPQFAQRTMLVHVYADGDVSSGRLIASFPANLALDHNDVVNIYGSHEFYYPIPFSLKDGAIHQLYAYESDASGSGQLSLLLGSPKDVACTKI